MMKTLNRVRSFKCTERIDEQKQFGTYSRNNKTLQQIGCEDTTIVIKTHTYNESFLITIII